MGVPDCISSPFKSSIEFQYCVIYNTSYKILLERDDGLGSFLRDIEWNNKYLLLINNQ